MVHLCESLGGGTGGGDQLFCSSWGGGPGGGDHLFCFFVVVVLAWLVRNSYYVCFIVSCFTFFVSGPFN